MTTLPLVLFCLLGAASLYLLTSQSVYALLMALFDNQPRRVYICIILPIGLCHVALLQFYLRRRRLLERLRASHLAGLDLIASRRVQSPSLPLLYLSTPLSGAQGRGFETPAKARLLQSASIVAIASPHRADAAPAAPTAPAASTSSSGSGGGGDGGGSSVRKLSVMLPVQMKPVSFTFSLQEKKFVDMGSGALDKIWSSACSASGWKKVGASAVHIISSLSCYLRDSHTA